MCRGDRREDIFLDDIDRHDFIKTLAEACKKTGWQAAGWYLGGQEFKKQMLERMEGKLGEHHSGELRRETAEAKAERIVAEELARLGWSETDLAGRRKSDPEKLVSAVRLRKETTLTIKAIAARVHLGTSRSAGARLQEWSVSRAPAESAQGELANQRTQRTRDEHFITC